MSQIDFAMHDMQTDLNNLYLSYWEGIMDLKKQNENLSYPLLIKIPKSYCTQKVKLMIVGQQTLGWGKEGIIEDLLARYQEFNFGETYYATPFWNMIRKIEKILSSRSI